MRYMVEPVPSSTTPAASAAPDVQRILHLLVAEQRMDSDLSRLLRKHDLHLLAAHVPRKRVRAGEHAMRHPRHDDEHHAGPMPELLRCNHHDIGPDDDNDTGTLLGV